MQYSTWLRLVVAGGAVVATIGSATSNQQPQPTGYYPQAQAAPGQPAAPPPPEAAPAPPPVAAAGSCDAFCDHVAQCNLGTVADCVRQCRESKLEQQQNGPELLTELSQASCDRLSELAQAPAQQPAPQPAPQPAQQPAPQPAPAQTSSIPAKRTQWVCNATGWWQKCESNGFTCYPQTTFMLGFGSTEPLARVSAETACNTAMTRLMSVNFTYRTSVTQRCKAISCSPPNAR